jgi:hypothetical protein
MITDETDNENQAYEITTTEQSVSEESAVKPFRDK